MRTVLIMKKFGIPLLVVILGASTAACGPQQGSSEIVATNAVLASIVQEVVGDTFHVDSVIPNGKDPHEFQPSAGDVARVANARVVVSNGFGYEPTLEKALASARADGVTVFDAQWKFPGLNDPHWFTDPLTAADAMAALVPVLEKVFGVSLDEEFAAATVEFEKSVADGRRILSEVPSTGCVFATEHVFLAPFGNRFGCHGSVVLNMGSRVPDAEPSAADIERFIGDIKQRGIKALVEDASETSRILDSAAGASGARIVKVNVHGMGDASSYRDYIVDIAKALAEGLR